MKDTNFFSVN